MAKVEMDCIKVEKNEELEKIKKQLEEKYHCYVLITCTNPSDKGKMKVELNYSGDDNLASFLVDGAQSVFCNQENEAKDSY